MPAQSNYKHNLPNFPLILHIYETNITFRSSLLIKLK